MWNKVTLWAAAPWKQDRNTESSLSASHLMPAKERYKKKQKTTNQVSVGSSRFSRAAKRTPCLARSDLPRGREVMWLEQSPQSPLVCIHHNDRGRRRATGACFHHHPPHPCTTGGNYSHAAHLDPPRTGRGWQARGGIMGRRQSDGQGGRQGRRRVGGGKGGGESRRGVEEKLLLMLFLTCPMSLLTNGRLACVNFHLSNGHSASMYIYRISQNDVYMYDVYIRKRMHKYFFCISNCTVYVEVQILTLYCCTTFS